MNLYNFEVSAATLGEKLVRARRQRRVTRSALAMGAGINYLLPEETPASRTA